MFRNTKEVFRIITQKYVKKENTWKQGFNIFTEKRLKKNTK